MLNFFSVETQLFQTHTHAPTFPEEGWQRIGETWNRKWNSSLCHLLYRGLFSHENPLNNADLFNVALVLSIHSIDNELETVWMMEPQSVVRMESYACDGFSQTVVVWFFGYMMVWWGSWTRAQGVDLFTWPKEEKKSRPGLFLPACMFLWASVYRREGERLFTRAQMPSTGRKVFQMSVEMPKQNARNPLFPLLDEAPRNWLIPLCKLNLAHHPLAR